MNIYLSYNSCTDKRKSFIKTVFDAADFILLEE